MTVKIIGGNDKGFLKQSTNMNTIMSHTKKPSTVASQKN